MALGIELVTNFIRERIVEPGLAINNVPETRPIYLSYVDFFEANGWSTEPIDGQPTRYRTFTPDGVESVTIKGVSATRHPAVTTRICRFKHLTKKMLDLASLPNPRGAEFLSEEKNVALEYFHKLPKPVVVKPTNGASSDGVTVGVSSSKDFDKAWTRALSAGNDQTRVLLEEYVAGIELRTYVIDSEVVAAVVRIPPFVIGDGESTVSELLEAERIARQVNRKVRARIIPDWDFVADFGHTKNSVPFPGEILVLHPFKTTGLGALFFDITDELSLEIKDIAVRATNAIPHLEISGIDLLVKDLDNPETVQVLEVNTTPASDLHRYPAFGVRRPVEKYVADFYHNEYVHNQQAYVPADRY